MLVIKNEFYSWPWPLNWQGQGHFIKDGKKIYRFKHSDLCFFKRKWDIAYLGSVVQLE